MRNKRNYLILILILIIFTTYSPRNTLETKFLSIEKIILIQDNIKNLNIPYKEFEFLKGKNILSVSQIEFEPVLTKYPLIKEIRIRKIYPHQIEIDVKLKNILGIILNKKNKKLISINYEILNFKNEYNFENLPLIYGGEENFNKIYDILKEVNFPINEIKTYYFFDINRWDLKLHDDKIIKLPNTNAKDSLLNFIENYESDSFNKFKIFDYRIRDELILK